MDEDKDISAPITTAAASDNDEAADSEASEIESLTSSIAASESDESVHDDSANDAAATDSAATDAAATDPVSTPQVATETDEDLLTQTTAAAASKTQTAYSGPCSARILNHSIRLETSNSLQIHHSDLQSKLHFLADWKILGEELSSILTLDRVAFVRARTAVLQESNRSVLQSAGLMVDDDFTDWNGPICLFHSPIPESSNVDGQITSFSASVQPHDGFGYDKNSMRYKFNDDLKKAFGKEIVNIWATLDEFGWDALHNRGYVSVWVDDTEWLVKVFNDESLTKDGSMPPIMIVSVD